MGSSGWNSDACGSSGRNRSDGCSDPGVIQTVIRLACNISTLSGNQKVEHLLNHFTPGDGYEFAHQAGAEGGEQMEDICSTGLAYRLRVAGAFPCEVWRVL